MEDRVVVADPLGGPTDLAGALLAVFDGHGGAAVAEFAQRQLPHHVLRNHSAGSDPADALRRAFLTVDADIPRAGLPGSVGATAVVAWVVPGAHTADGGRVLHVASCGDSRALYCPDILSGAPVATKMSTEHKPTVPAERERIQRCGGEVLRDRVQGVLAVSRALGDHSLKAYVSAEPALASVAVPVGASGRACVILGCDGVFDVMSDDEALRVVANRLAALRDGAGAAASAAFAAEAAPKLADALVKEALKRESRDNISAVVALL